MHVLAKTVCIFYFFVFFSTYAQGVPALKPEHKKKVYLNGKNLYWPMDLPFFVSLSSSPDENAPKYLLKPSFEKESKRNTNGIRLEINGRQFIRWINYVTKDEIKFRFFSDGEAPRTKLMLENAPYYNKNNIDFYGKGLRLGLKSKDNLSGVRSIFLAINDSSFFRYKDTIYLDSDTSYTIAFYGLDNVGYAEKTHIKRIVTDFKAPESFLDVRDNYIADILSRQSKIILDAKDYKTGVRNIFYGFENDTSTLQYNGKHVSVGHLKDGLHKLRYYSYDHVNNKEKENIYEFYLDRLAPSLRLNVIGDLYKNDSISYISPRSLFNLLAKDNKAGLKEIEYKVDQKDLLKYSSLFVGPSVNGSFVIKFRAIDKLQNISAFREEHFVMDIDPPRVENKLIGNVFSQKTVSWISGETKILFEAKDNLSGLKKIQYQLGTNPEPVDYDSAVTIKAEGQYLCRYWAIDNVLNKGVGKSILFIVDNTAPEIIETISLNAVDTLYHDTGEAVRVYPSYISVFLGAVDKSSGVKEIYYSVNGGKESKYHTAIMFEKSGFYKISARATDYLGHTSTKNISFQVKDRFLGGKN